MNLKTSRITLLRFTGTRRVHTDHLIGPSSGALGQMRAQLVK